MMLTRSAAIAAVAERRHDRHGQDARCDSSRAFRLVSDQTRFTSTDRDVGRGQFQVAHGAVTTDTRDLARPGVGGRAHRLDDGLVAAAAVRLGDRPAGRQRADWLGERAGGEVERMPEAVAGLRRILGHERVGHVTVVAHGDRAMAALDPAVVLLVHDVAVRAGPRVVGHVGPASRVGERVGAEAERGSEHRHDNHNRRVGSRRLHWVCSSTAPPTMARNTQSMKRAANPRAQVVPAHSAPTRPWLIDAAGTQAATGLRAGGWAPACVDLYLHNGPAGGGKYGPLGLQQDQGRLHVFRDAQVRERGRTTT